MKIILASASPRRKELLAQIGYEFEVRPARGEEYITETDPEAVVRELAFQKASEIAGLELTASYLSKEIQEPVLVIGADTIVVKDDHIYGKPANEKHALEMLETLQGTTHQVYTGVCLMILFENVEDPAETHVIQFAECTDVTMYSATEQQLLEYIATGEPLDKAGAYGIQGLGARFIKEIHGDYNNVVGLPVGRIWQELQKAQI